MNKKLFGDRAERMAIEYLQELGWQIIDQNFRTRWGEIDCIAIHERCLVFVEVRYRKRTSYTDPAESISSTKRRNLLAAAQIFQVKISRNKKLLDQFNETRFDLIGYTEKGISEHRHGIFSF